MMAVAALIGVIPLFIKFTNDLGDAYKAGDVKELPEIKARMLIEMGDAEEADSLAVMRASDDAKFARLREELLGEIRGLRGGAVNGNGNGAPPANGTPPADGNGRRVPQPPGTRGTAEFGDRPQQTPIVPKDLTWEERNFHAGRMVQALVASLNPYATGHEREWGRNLMTNLYTKEQVQYTVSEDGESREAFTDGVEVARTGTSSISGGPTYGFLVRPEWSDVLFRIPLEESVIEPYCLQIPVGQALEFRMPALDQYGTPKPGQAAGYAFFELHRRGEITQRPYSDGKVREIDWKITDLTAFTTWSRDLDADAFLRIGAMIQQVLGQAFVWKKDYEYLLGNGVGMPLGILNGGQGNTNLHPSVLIQGRHAANNITYNDIVRMMQRIHPSYWREMYFLTNAAQTLEVLSALKDDAGNYVFQPNSLVGQWNTPSIMGPGQPHNELWWRAEGRLQGKPVIFSEKLPQLGTLGDLILLNPRRAYGIASRLGLEMGMSEHFLFDTDRIAVRWKCRNDARPMLVGPYIQSDGGITTGNSKVSWCVCLGPPGFVQASEPAAAPAKKVA